MFDSTLEFIAQAASNSLVIFCFCNLIIVMIIAGSKPSSNFDREREIPLLTIDRTCTDSKQGTTMDGNKMLKDTSESSTTQEAPNKYGEEMERDVGHFSSNQEASPIEDVEENSKDDSNGDDELRRRVEEFIDKVNKGWKAELLKKPCLVYQ
ncbi:hypothetical protein HS088_TW19G00702 [Tripterygium wilfordii]|uniref:Uncharacterized protein n=1 Tax=Tripterygium wilfordii TaxID=458696 RepID=A0A7J7CAC5_TRIWF|nr:hypothetical protein HS088_TW19G00702 [Tripterygium wilfordii]